MAELDAVQIKNPTLEDFTHNYNGEPYTIKVGETKSFAKYVAFHLAKHLSTKMIVEDLEKKATKKELEELQTKANSRLASSIGQLNVYDSPERRIALYKMLGNKDLVQTVIKSYPFKGFVGEMATYDKFVEESNSLTKE